MKLTIEHLCGYIPYKLKAEYRIGDKSKIIEMKHTDFQLIFDESYIYSIKPILYRVEDMSIEQIIQWGKLVRTHFPEEFDKDGMTDESILKNAPEALSLIKELGFDAFEEITFKQSLLLSKFFYSNHIDIHNLIDANLAVDGKTLTPHP